jgi:hypothetical protein
MSPGSSADKRLDSRRLGRSRAIIDRIRSRAAIAAEVVVQLRVARVCLDCEEIHDQQTCPVCASETFAYISRWVPSPERRKTPTEPAPPGADPEAAPTTPRTRLEDIAEVRRELRDATAPPGKSRKVAYGVAGVAAAVLAGYWYRGRRKLEDAAERGAGELK